MRIVVTGASGLLGANCVLVLAPRHDVIGTCGFTGATLAGRPLARLDLRDADATAAFLRAARPELVIHCAALTDVDYCEAHPTAAGRLNGRVPGELAAVAAELGAGFVQISTDAVYPGVQGPYSEGDALGPVNAYARSKAAGEDAVLAAHPRPLVLRTTMHGWNLQARRSFSEAILDGLLHGRRLTLFDDVRFSPLCADEIAELAEELWLAGTSGVLNVGARDGVDKCTFGRMVALEFALDASSIEAVKLAERNLPAPRPHDVTLDTTRLAALLGRAPSSVADGIARLRRRLAEGHVTALKGRPATTLEQALGGASA